MFFRKNPPTKLEIAQKAVSNAAHSLLESAPTERLLDFKNQALDVLAHTGENVAAKIENARHSAEEFRKKADEDVETGVQTAQTRALAAKKAAEIAIKAADKAARDAKAKADAHIQQLQTQLSARKGELEQQEARLEDEAQRLQAQTEAQIKAEQSEREKIAKNAKPADNATIYEDEAIEVHVRHSQPGGSPLILIGVALIIGAALVYLFAPGSGRRSRAALKDKLDQLKDSATTKGKELAARAEDAKNDASEKVAQTAEKASESIEKTESNAEVLAVETYEDAIPHQAGIANDVSDAIDDTTEAARETLDAAKNSAEGVAAEAKKSRRKPNVFDKAAEVAHNAADKVEDLADGEEKPKNGDSPSV